MRRTGVLIIVVSALLLKTCHKKQEIRRERLN